MPSSPKVAIVCDWLTGIGGAERVVLELHKLYPDAPIYTSQYDTSKLDWFKDADVRTGWLQQIPTSLKKFLPVLRMFYFHTLDLREYDLVISSSGAEAKGVRVRPGSRHVCYMHAPTHYYWSRYEAYLAHPGFGKFDWLARIGLRLLITPLRFWDKRFAQRPTSIITNSHHSERAIRRYYARDSTVIYPPVETTRFSNSAITARRSQYVITGRQTPYKKIDLAVIACTALSRELIVIGNGPDHDKLRDLAGETIQFLTDATDADVVRYVSQARAFIFPGIDDFGIAAVEALAAGTPVIAFAGGGAEEYVIDGTNGRFFHEQTANALEQAIEAFETDTYDHAAVAASAERFSVDTFRQEIKAYLADEQAQEPR